MAWSAKQIYDLNNMNVAAQNVALGTTLSDLGAFDVSTISGEVDALQLQAMNRGKYTVTAGNDSANTCSIPTGLTVAGYIVQIYRGGVQVTSDAAISASTTNLVVANGSTYVLTANDSVMWTAWA
jgi:hypothetical protein